MPSSPSRAAVPATFALAAGLLLGMLPVSRAEAVDSGLEGALSRLYRQVSPAVVKIVSHRVSLLGPYGAPGSGAAVSYRKLVATGVVLSEHGCVVTTDRAAEPGDSLMVQFPDGRQSIADYLGTHAALHLAVLHLRAAGPFPSLVQGAPGDALPEWVAAVAYGPCEGPVPGRPTLSFSQRGAMEPMKVRCGDSLGTVWRLKAPFYPGSGGGALVSLSGQWVGLITGAVATPGFAPDPLAGGQSVPWDEGVIVPASLVSRAVEEIESGPRACVQGFLGVIATRRAGAAADTAPPAPGVRVAGILGGSPAERFGILPGDILMRFNGTVVENAEQLTHLVCATTPGKDVRVDLLRKGVGRTLQISLGNRASGEIDLARRRHMAVDRVALRREIHDLENRAQQLQRQLDQLEATERAGGGRPSAGSSASD